MPPLPAIEDALTRPCRASEADLPAPPAHRRTGCFLLAHSLPRFGPEPLSEGQGDEEHKQSDDFHTNLTFRIFHANSKGYLPEARFRSGSAGHARELFLV